MPSKINHHALQPAIRIGKAGITENVVKQIITMIRKKRVIKVRFLPSAIHGDKKELVKELAERTKTRIVHKVGFIAVLERIR
ncbi:MAG: YhbY family RNA-binding protein [Candidatus Woesearchaeota archaeon]|nr:YhbY family RNA-binding protein [Candidatus Woesearchaeota archaeon]